MRLVEALRLDRSARLALVGAGGKTSALFSLGRQLLKPLPVQTAQAAAVAPPIRQAPAGAAEASAPPAVILTATTHLAMEQLALADRHYTLQDIADLDDLEQDLPSGVLLFTGPASDDQRTRGLPEPIMERLRQLADLRSLPMLIEADGSRRRPLKAPAAHEPVTPLWARQVAVVAGLSALGKPLNADWVHRPEIFSALSDAPLNLPITPEGLTRLLLHPQGGLKNIPQGARRLALLNQADTLEMQGIARRMAQSLLQEYGAVVVASIPGRASSTRQEDQSKVIAVHERIAGVILAAGGAQRMGQPKQALIWRGQPLVRHVAQAALEAGLAPVVVIVGSAAEQVEAAVQGLPVQLVRNPEWQLGQSSSVKAGVSALPAETGAAVFLLADQPRTPVQLIVSLMEAHAATLSPLVAPLVQGQRANPVLLDRITFPDLLALSGDQGGRALFARYPAYWVPWHDPTILQDIDTPEDYQRLLET
jgi:molybdenum cofactor cytidylyltransferase